MTAVARFFALLIGDVLCGLAAVALMLLGWSVLVGAIYGIARLLVRYA